MENQPSPDSVTTRSIPHLFEPSYSAFDTREKEARLALDVIEKIASVYTPSFDVKETKDDFVFKTDLPGLVPEDVDVEVCEGCLTIAGERPQDSLGEGEYYYALDRHWGAFCLTFQLPQGAAGDQVNAWMANGVLTVKVPKGAPGAVNRVLISTEH